MVDNGTDCPGIKYVSCDIQAAIMIEQLKKLDLFIKRRNEITEMYDTLLSKNSHITLQKKNNINFVSNHYLYWIKVEKRYRDDLINYLKDNNVYCTVKYWPLHLTQLFKDNNVYPIAENNIETLINLPIHQNISNGDVIYTTGLIESFF